MLRPLSSGIRSPLGTAPGQVSQMTMTATTGAPGQTVTIHRMTPVGGNLTIFWGDGNSTVVTPGDTAAKSNVYASAGNHSIKIVPASRIQQVNVHDTQLSGVKSAELINSPITYWQCYSIGNVEPGQFDSADVASWNPTWFYLYSMPAGYTGTFDSVDVVGWNPTYFWLSLMPAGYTITPGGGWANFARCTIFYIHNNGLIQADVDAILWELYQAATIPRTGAGGAIWIHGSNAAPSGVYQPAAACPVNVGTPGKEVCHELEFDGCGAGFNTWTTVTFT